jgi:hypothetical protein
MDILVVEPTSLTLSPHGSYHFDLGLYDKLSVLSWALKCILFIVLAGAAHQLSRKRCGADIATACALLVTPSLLMSPWTSPLLLVVHI